MANSIPIPNTSRAQDVIMQESPGSLDEPKRIVVVVDALKEFSLDLIEWVLKNFTLNHCCILTILGIMPWLNIPLSSKTWSDIWYLNLEDLSSFEDNTDCINDPKSLKVQRLVALCRRYGVVPQIRTEMGHPLKLLVVERIGSLGATLAVFDRHHDKKNIEYYATKVPCNMLVVNENGDVDLIKKAQV